MDLSNRTGLLRRTLLATVALAAVTLASTGMVRAQGNFIVMASTTSTEQSGLFAHLLPAFKAASGTEVRVVALGTGQALDMGRRGDADILFVHDQAAEEKFVADGFSTRRLAVMYNDFVLIGPAADPARLRGKDITAALQKLASPPPPRPAPVSSRAVTRAAPTPPSCATGKPPAPTSPPPSPPATRSAAAAWARR
jgi:tungstate transport system substrate-binding protein